MRTSRSRHPRSCIQPPFKVPHFCWVLAQSPGTDLIRCKGMKTRNRETHKMVRLGGYTVEKGHRKLSRMIICSWAARRGYFIQTNMEAEFTVHSWSRRQVWLILGTVSGGQLSSGCGCGGGGESYGRHFPHTLTTTTDPEGFAIALWASSWETVALPFLHRSETEDCLTRPCLVNNTHPPRPSHSGLSCNVLW